MISDRGFTFNGIHSSVYHVYCNPESRVLIPEVRKTGITIPGRSGLHFQKDGAYNIRSESMTCWYTPISGMSLADQTREIAAWLAEEGTLVFDNEPDKYYIACFSGAPPLTRHQKYGEFTLTFTYSPPFAFSALRTVSRVVTRQNADLVVPVDGTVETPCRIIIRNDGTGTIDNITIEHSLI